MKRDHRHLLAVPRHACWLRTSRFVLSLAMVGLLACESAGSEPDLGTDASVDSGTDSGTDSGMDSGMDSGLSELRMFVTETVQNANLGGIEGADGLCAAQAADANLQGEFKAWLSTRSSAVADRLTRANVPYVLVNETPVADNWDDLVNGSILAPINLDAKGEAHTGDVWTGTLANGDSYPNDDCAGFTSSSAGIALCGDSTSKTETWTNRTTPACSVLLRLYCIEQ